MKYLLDTCVISEVVKNQPNKKVISWLNSQDENDLYLSVLTFGEIAKGINKINDQKRKRKLQLWLDEDLKSRFKNRIIAINLTVSIQWGIIQAAAEQQGKTMPAIDGLIAVSGLVNHCIVVTRNINDMQQSSVELFNPWKESHTMF